MEYARAYSISETTASRYAANDGHFLKKLREGGKCTVDKYVQARDFFKKKIKEKKMLK